MQRKCNPQHSYQAGLTSTAMELWRNSSKGHRVVISPMALPLCVSECVLIMGPGSRANCVHHMIWHVTVLSSSSKISSSTWLAFMKIRHQNWTNGPWEENTVSWIGLVLQFTFASADSCHLTKLCVLTTLGQTGPSQDWKGQQSSTNYKRKQWFTHHGELVILENTSPY